jgi:transposase-like protein
MSQVQGRDSRKAQQWRRWIEQQQESGLSVRAFCDRHDLAEPSFYGWRREITRRDAAAGAFLPVSVVGEEAPGPACCFEVVLVGGRTLRVAPGFDAATLRQLLAVLEEVRVC